MSGVLEEHHVTEQLLCLADFLCKFKNFNFYFVIRTRQIVLGNNGNTACHLGELDIVGFMIDSGLKLSHEQHEPDWQNCSLEHFALISAN